MYWLTAIKLAKVLDDVTFEEWCDLYVPFHNPHDEQIAKASSAARKILVRNNLIHESVKFTYIQ